MLSLINAVAGRPWAIRADIAYQVRGIVAKEGFAGLRHLAQLKTGIHAFDDDDGGPRPRAARTRAAQTGGSIAVIPVIGTLTQRVEVINSAATRSTADIADEVREAAAEPKVDAILLEIDSPGGEVYGVPEAWEVIRAARKKKPCVAIANSVAASAALYLASASTEFWVTPSGTAGSVGVFALHVDISQYLEREGEVWSFIVASESPFKVEGNPAEPLSDDARAALQKDVDRYMDMFVRDLARGRGVSRERVGKGFGRGRMLSPEEAVAAKMADQVGPFEQALARAAQLGREARESAAGVGASIAVPGPSAQIDAPAPKVATPCCTCCEGAQCCSCCRGGGGTGCACGGQGTDCSCCLEGGCCACCTGEQCCPGCMGSDMEDATGMAERRLALAKLRTL